MADKSRMERFWIIGCSGSGKSTLARRLAEQLGIPSYELDGIFHKRNWTQMRDEDFCRRVSEIVATKRWIVDGNYFNRCPGVIAARAELVVWLDLPRLQTCLRVVRRTLRRVIRKEELWNGNREKWTNVLNPNPERNMILRTWRQHPVYRSRYKNAVELEKFGEAKVLRVRTSKELTDWISKPIG